MRKIFHELFKTKKRIAFVSILLAIIVLRAVLPEIIRSRVNHYLANFSPVYSIHIGELDIGFLTFSYTGKNTVGTYKKNNSKFFETKDVRVQISWRELLHLRILTDVRIDEGSFILTKELFNQGAAKPEEAKEAAKKAAEAMFPLRVAVIEFQDCSFDFADFAPFADADQKTRWRVTDINSQIVNINPTDEEPFSGLIGEGKFLGLSPFIMHGRALRMKKPMAWSADFEMRDFNLKNANPMLLHYLPITFTKGSLDLYAELKSQNGTLEGYLKPFLKDAQILNSKEDYKSFKHFAIEIIGAFANFMLKNADDKTLATKIEFMKKAGGQFEIQGLDAAIAAAKHGYVQELKKGVENTLTIKN